MNPDRVLERGLRFESATGAVLEGFRLVFNKASRAHAGVGHANIQLARDQRVEGVLYKLCDNEEIRKMDRFESTPVNYSRDLIEVRVGSEYRVTWTYFANPAVRQTGLLPPRSYLDHLLAGRQFLSIDYYRALSSVDCDEQR
jgi:gamma-glutamylcyclotransferase (GGCT)/AIG2-like uncharacterized protein YtfP